MIDDLRQQLQKTRIIASQHRLQLENALLHYQYLLNDTDSPQVLMASRLAKFSAIIGDTRQNLDEYFNKFTFFALKLKEDVAQFLAESEAAAWQIDKNRFHIATALQKFPNRDFNPQTTEKHDFSPQLRLMCNYLDDQFLISKRVAQNTAGTDDTEEIFRDEFLQILEKFNDDFFASESFAELFSEIYVDESASQPESSDSEEAIAGEN